MIDSGYDASQSRIIGARSYDKFLHLSMMGLQKFRRKAAVPY
jgi:hypothetical protein